MAREDKEKTIGTDPQITKDFWSMENLESIFGREAEELAVAHERKDKILGKGLFLEKLWSAVDYTLREQPHPVLEVTRQRMDELFLEIFHRDQPDLREKVVLVMELRDIADKYAHVRPEELPAHIDAYAELNEKWAMAELKKLKEGAPDFWVQRKKDFKPQLDTMFISLWTARSLLKDYERLADSHERPKK